MHSNLAVLIIAGGLAVLPGAAAAAAPHHQDTQATLQREAKISMPQARDTALARVHGKVASEELEREHGKLIYSFDIRVPKQSGITEVTVSAINGRILSVTHETPAHERAEAKAEASAAKHR